MNKVEGCNQNSIVEAQCEYLVVGAGTAGMSFIDTLLSEHSTATVILVDRNGKPGGHWTKAYPFVKLHQPSCFYGVNSEKLGKTLDKDGNEKFDIHDRATGKEILEYYSKVLQKFQTTGRFTSYFGAEYHGEELPTSSSHDSCLYKTSTIHSIVTSSGNTLRVRCKKLVMIHTKVTVPSMRKAPFPVDEGVNFIPVNDLATQKKRYTNFVILGAGKTSADAIIELLESGVDQSSIKWVISQDVWFFIREKLWQENEFHFKMANRILKPFLTKNSVKDVFLHLEKKGVIGRLDVESFPEVFKGPTISFKELKLLRTVKDTVKLGRVTSINADGVMVFGGNDDDCDESPNEVHLSSNKDSTVFVDCMAFDGYGYIDFQEDMKIFEPNKINLGPLPVIFNPSFASALIAYMETKTEDDETKNACFFYPTKSSITYVELLRGFYCQLKTLTFLGKTYSSSLQFIVNSRTNQDSSSHHGGLFKILWAQFGPMQLQRKAQKFIERVEGGKFCDCMPEKVFKDRQLPPKL